MGVAHPLRLGIKLAPQATSVEDLRAVWRIADQSGFDHLWGFDHFAAIGGPAERPIYEGWTMLAAMAEATKRVRIGLLVTGATYRHPGVLAKIATTVDHLSTGRLEFGIGSGWAENEHTMLGIPFHTVAGRIRRMEETIEVCKRLWTEERSSYEGTYFRLEEAIHEPKPIQKPYPPIWVGGSGEQLTLRVAAKYADVWNPSGGGGDPEEAARLSAVLDERCREVGRDPNAIRRSVQHRFDASDPAAFVEKSRQFIERGFTEIIAQVSGDAPPRQADLLAEKVLPALRGD
ncbi:MAG TPA: LLM class F420-dependent oxidoreductase [Candidatus Dormibacteraeota bacterium]